MIRRLNLNKSLITVLLRNFCSLGTSDGKSGKKDENTGLMNSPGQTTAANNGT